jgi:hypothetical protein
MNGLGRHREELRFAICGNTRPICTPIETPFSKLKASPRKAAERTIPCLRRRIGRFPCTLTAREARNYFRRAAHEWMRAESALGVDCQIEFQPIEPIDLTA